jgi:hypothetical protein
MAGDTSSASARYLEALRTDARIIDTNVCLSSIFTDPRPGAAARHGSDADILACLSAVPDAATSPALVLRRLLGAATLLNEDRRNQALKPEIASRLREDMLWTGRELVRLLDEVPLRAHAALFHALSFELLGYGAASPKAAAWEQARNLQEESVRQGQAGTPPYLFNVLEVRYRQGRIVGGRW